MGKFRIGTKIGLGFTLVILNMAALVGIVTYMLKQADENISRLQEVQMPAALLVNQYDTNALEILVYTSNFLLNNKDTASLQRALDTFGPMATSMFAQGNELLAKSTETREALSKMLTGLDGRINAWKGMTNDVVRATEDRAQTIAELNATGAKMLETLNAYSETMDNVFRQQIDNPDVRTRVIQLSPLVRELTFEFSDIETNIFRAQYANDAAMLRDISKSLEKLDALVMQITPFTTNQQNQERLKQISAYIQQYREILGRSAETVERANALIAQSQTTSRELRSLFALTTENSFTAMESGALTSVTAIGTTQLLSIIAFAVCVVLSIIIALVITRTVVNPVKVTTNALSSIADGDFTVQIPREMLTRGDEMGVLLNDVQKTCDNLSTTISSIMGEAGTVATAARQISQGNQQLSEQTQQQAGAIEETASALEQMTSSVRNNAENAAQANNLAHTTSKMAQEGGQVVSRTVGAMKEVTESSKKINDIINVVNEIAFQTNLLALNAAVEAARAGEAGKGFAVVAGEVRNLAGRSADAAKEIQALISDSVSKIDQGNTLVAESGKILSEIIANVQQVADTIGEITSASQEQATGIAEVSKAVNQMDEAVQQNAAFVEEAASASETMSNVAGSMRDQMSRFKVRDNVQQATRSLPAPQQTMPKPAARPVAAKPAAKPAPSPKPAAAKSAAPKSAPAAKPAGNMEDDFFGVSDMDGFEEF